MPTDPLLRISTRRTPQSEPIPGLEAVQKRNSAGGYVFTLEPLDQLKRFLILGTEGGTYYTREHELTKQNAAVVMACLDKHHTDAVDVIVNGQPTRIGAFSVLAWGAATGPERG